MRIRIRAVALVLFLTPTAALAQKIEAQPDETRHFMHHDEHEGDDENGLSLGLSVASNYNRVEGLPLMFGPVLRAGDSNRLELSGQAIWRTDPSASLGDDVGYRVRADQGLFDGRVRVSGEAISWARPIETQGLGSTEPGLAALLFHSDLHDYYEERAWGLNAELRPWNAPLELRVGFRQADHDAVAVSDPWSLFRDEERWRMQPVVAEGRASLLSLRASYDTRPQEEHASRGRGMLASFTLEHALDNDLAMPAVDFGGTSGGGETFDDFTLARIDLRMHRPVTEWSTLGVRLFAAGSVERTVLAPQYQRALGGIGSLPGFALFEGSCGSRDVAVQLTSGSDDTAPVMLGGYGCDRVLLGQLEYRGGFGRPGAAERNDGVHYHGGWRFKGEMTPPQWALIVDAARGWAYGDLGFADRADTETLVDAGLGLVFQGAGVYAAVPVTGDEHELRFVVRLQQRF